MNKISLAITAVLAIGAAASASAQNGTISVNGNVTAQTCSITFPGNGTGSNPTVTLPDVAAASLTAAGQTAGLTPIVVEVSAAGGGACAAGTTAALELNPNRTAAVDVNGDLVNSTATTRVNVRMRDSNDEAINLSNPWRSEEIGMTAGEQIKFAAEYIATGAAVAGNVAATVQYTMVYN